MDTGISSRSLPQGIFPTQGLNPGLLHCRRILHPLSHQGRPRILEWVAYPSSRGSSWPRNRTRVSCIAGRFFTSWATRGALKSHSSNLKADGFYVTPIQPLPSVCWGLNKLKGFPGGASSKEPACQCRGHKRLRFNPCVGKTPWRRAWQPTPVFLPRERTGEPGGLQPIGSQRIGHHWNDLACTPTQG